MKIDLTCPVELWQYQLPTREYPFCTLQLYNLADRNVSSIQATFVCYNAQGEAIARRVERVENLPGLSKHSFEMTVGMEDGVQAVDLEFILEKVWYEDGTLWRRGAAEMSEYQPNALPAGRVAARLIAQGVQRAACRPRAGRPAL